MPELTRKAFADLAGCGTSAVSNAVKKNKIVVNDNNKIDPAHPQNKIFLSADRSTRSSKHKRAAMREQSNVEDMTSAELEIEKARADIRVKRANELDKLIKIEQAKGNLIERDQVLRILQQFGEAIRSNFLDLPKMISVDLTAEAQKGNHALRQKLAKEIEQAVKKSKIDALEELL